MSYVGYGSIGNFVFKSNDFAKGHLAQFKMIVIRFQTTEDTTKKHTPETHRNAPGGGFEEEGGVRG